MGCCSYLPRSDLPGVHHVIRRCDWVHSNGNRYRLSGLSPRDCSPIVSNTLEFLSEWRQARVTSSAAPHRRPRMPRSGCLASCAFDKRGLNVDFLFFRNRLYRSADVPTECRSRCIARAAVHHPGGWKAWKMAGVGGVPRRACHHPSKLHQGRSLFFAAESNEVRRFILRTATSSPIGYGLRVPVNHQSANFHRERVEPGVPPTHSGTASRNEVAQARVTDRRPASQM